MVGIRNLRNIDKVIEFMDKRYDVLDSRGWRKDYVRKHFDMSIMFRDVSDIEIIQIHVMNASESLGQPLLSPLVLRKMGIKKHTATRYYRLVQKVLDNEGISQADWVNVLIRIVCDNLQKT